MFVSGSINSGLTICDYCSRLTQLGGLVFLIPSIYIDFFSTVFPVSGFSRLEVLSVSFAQQEG